MTFHLYGPHDPSTAPTTVTCLRERESGVGQEEYEHPIPPQLLRQRQVLNTRAWRDAFERDYLEAMRDD